MPFLGGTGITATALQAERVYMADVAGTLDEATVYCDSVVGNDLNSGYDPTAPVKTLARAVQELPILGLTSRVGIRLTGLLPFAVPYNFGIPPMIRGGVLSSDQSDLDGLTLRGPVRIYSPAIELQFITALDIVSQLATDVSGLLTILTTLAFVPSAFSQCWVVDANGNTAAVQGNDANSLFVCTSSPLNAPLRVLTQGATIEQAVVNMTSTIRVGGGSCPVILQGLKIQGGGGGFFPAVDVVQGSAVFLQCCNAEGLFVNTEEIGMGLPSSAQLFSSTLRRNLSPGNAETQATNSYLLGLEFPLSRPTATIVLQNCVADGCQPIVFDAGFSGLSPGVVAVLFSRIVNAPGDGLKSVGNGVFFFVNVECSFAVGVGCFISGSKGRAFGVKGQSNGGGLASRNGAQVEVSNDTDINDGYVDALQVGSVLYVWGAFRPAPLNLFDVALPAGELARVYQP